MFDQRYDKLDAMMLPFFFILDFYLVLLVMYDEVEVEELFFGYCCCCCCYYYNKEAKDEVECNIGCQLCVSVGRIDNMED